MGDLGNIRKHKYSQDPYYSDLSDPPSPPIEFQAPPTSPVRGRFGQGGWVIRKLPSETMRATSLTAGNLGHLRSGRPIWWILAKSCSSLAVVGQTLARTGRIRLELAQIG